jgi:hypothetical protein
VAGDLITQQGLTVNADRHRAALRAWDDQETGYPDLRLAQVLDVAALVSCEDGVEEKYLHGDGFKGHRKAGEVKKRRGHAGSWRKTVSLVADLYRSGLFDRGDVRAKDNQANGSDAKDGQEIKSLDYRKVLEAGRGLVFDMAGLDSPQHRNLAISDLLRGVAEAQDTLYEAAGPASRPRRAFPECLGLHSR